MIRFMGLKAEELSKSQDTTLKMMPDSFGSDDAAFAAPVTDSFDFAELRELYKTDKLITIDSIDCIV